MKKQLGLTLSTFLLLVLPLQINSTSLTMANDISIGEYKGKDNHGQYVIQYPQFIIQPYAKNLNRYLKRLSLDTFLCENDPSKKEQMYTDVTAKPSFLSNQLLSYELQYEGYCGGPYPDAGTHYIIVDLKQGKLVDIIQQFKDFKQFKQVLDGEFINQRPSNYPQDCSHLITRDELSLMTPDFLLKDNVLIARQSYAHVARACEYDIKIRCSLMAPYLKHNAILFNFCS